MENNQEKPQLPPNFTHIKGRCYVVRTQAGFRQALKHYNGGDKFDEVQGYPKAYPSFVVWDRHEWKEIAYAQCTPLNEFIALLNAA